MTKWEAMRFGALVSVPMMLGNLPFGMIFGSLAVSQGLDPWVPIAMSLFVFAGSAQFVALGLFAVGTPILIVIFTTFIVNLRHLLYSADYMKYVKHLPMSWRAVLAFGLTDETYAATKPYFVNGKLDETTGHWAYLGSVVAFYTMWNLTTIIGVLAGELIPGMSEWGLEFAMVATFLGIITTYLRTSAYWISFAVAGTAALFLYQLPNNLGMLLAALLGVLAGVAVQHLHARLNTTKGDQHA
ncbi:AzlC family ABC transporter permease [uncultured Thiothrix sp.]|uniref:AzlC family ABC transporter permease n=1 Tax=uncultured Thiothrix sp. TaxID=223185 RepID=UPI0026254318|nr:AzlC family ABC transporter permease [uncultured Thiothrix sp.]HMT92844.1 AzlC family ABC transporter permease [Thiolinea sp.]